MTIWMVRIVINYIYTEFLGILYFKTSVSTQTNVDTTLLTMIDLEGLENSNKLWLM